MKPPARAVAAMPRSGIRDVMDLAMAREGVLRLEVGDPDFDTPPHVIEAATRAALDGFTHYTMNRGLLSLRELIAVKLAERNGIAATPEEVVVTTGGVTALMEALMALVEAGDEVLLPDPAWPNYEMMATTIGAAVVRYPLDRARGFEPDLDRLAELARRPRAKALVINSPGNPTGSVWSRATIERVLEIAQESDLYLVSDEVYEEMIFEGEHVSPAALDDSGRVISVYSFSKTYAMTGWRLGYVTAADELATLIAKVQEPVISCATAVAQKAGEAALAGPQECVSMMRDAYRGRRDLAVSLLRERGLLVSEPHGAFYIMADVGRATDDTLAFARRLVADYGVATAPGAAFGPGAHGLLRLSLASAPEVIEEGIARLGEAVEAWAGGRAAAVSR